jgi:hypothetical protein
VRFSDCQLHSVDFEQARLASVDFRGSELAHPRGDLSALRGAIVDSVQLVDLSHALAAQLGIVVRYD